MYGRIVFSGLYQIPETVAGVPWGRLEGMNWKEGVVGHCVLSWEGLRQQLVVVAYLATCGVVTKGHPVRSMGWAGSGRGEWLAEDAGMGCPVFGAHKDSASCPCHAAAKWKPLSCDLGVVPFLPYHSQS